MNIVSSKLKGTSKNDVFHNTKIFKPLLSKAFKNRRAKISEFLEVPFTEWGLETALGGGLVSWQLWFGYSRTKSLKILISTGFLIC
jgi:hypothetical protein